MRALFILALLAGGAFAAGTTAKPATDPQVEFCDKSVKAVASWSFMGLGVVLVLNFGIVAVIVYTLFAINNIPSETEKLVSSVRWLNRTAVRSAFGPSAKQALNDYAKSLPELVGLTGEKNIADKKE